MAARGFTLIELMITVAIIAVLAMVALPAYQDQVRKSRRADAINALAAIQQAQERFRANNTSYTTALTTAWPAGLGQTSSTPGGYYTVAVSAANATGYTATATAASSQTSDTKCSTLSVVLNAGAITYGSTGSATAKQCWNR
jgi:type IV pilus assembly protein PilE